MKNLLAYSALLSTIIFSSQAAIADQSAELRMMNSQQVLGYDAGTKKTRPTGANQQVIRLVVNTGTVGYTCGPSTCVCSGDDDCNNMFTSACSADTSGDTCEGDTCECNSN